MRARGAPTAAVVAVLLATLAILGATTLPTGDQIPVGHPLCVLCGERGSADALLNVALFAPFGAALAFARVPVRRAIIIAALFSALIETAQLLILRGRDANVGDILFNTLGGAVGAGLGATAAAWIAPSARRSARLAWAWSTLTGIVIAGIAFLFTPSLPRTVYYTEWSSSGERLEWYDGEVVGATLGGSEVSKGHIDAEHSDRMRSALLAGERLEVRAVAGPRPSHLMPLLTVSLDDESLQGIALVGVDRDDLVLRYRTRSGAVRLAEPELRAPGLMRGATAGDSIRVAVWKEADVHCLESTDERQCGIALPLGRGWVALLGVASQMPAWLVRFVDALWIGGMFAPLGYWIGRSARSMLALVPAGISFVVAGSLSGLMRTTGGDVAGAIVGLVAGGVVAAAMIRIGRRSQARASEPGRNGPALSSPDEVHPVPSIPHAL